MNDKVLEKFEDINHSIQYAEFEVRQLNLQLSELEDTISTCKLEVSRLYFMLKEGKHD